MSRQLEKIRRDLERHTAGEVKALSTGLFVAIREDTANTSQNHGSPVESGRYSASVRMDVGKVDDSAEPFAASHKRGGPRTINLAPTSRFTSRLSAFVMGASIYISVTLPYSRRIEDGYSKRKAPQGVFGKSIRYFVPKFRSTMVADRSKFMVNTK